MPREVGGHVLGGVQGINRGVFAALAPFFFGILQCRPKFAYPRPGFCDTEQFPECIDRVGGVIYRLAPYGCRK